MQQLAAAIRNDIDRLAEQYDADLRQMSGYDHLPAALRHDLERRVLNLIAQCMETGDQTALVQYVQQRAAQWESLGFPLTWFQQALVIPEKILTPLISSVGASNFLWQALNRSQGVVWQMVAERAHQAEERFRSIVETSHSGVLITDDAFHLTYANDELVQISGYAREELLGVDFRRLLDEESRRIVADNYLRRQRGEDAPSRYEVAFLRKDGTKRYIEMSAVSLKDLNGKSYTVAQVLDVSERKQAEQALRASEAQYQTIFDATPIMFWLKDTHNRTLRVNKAAAVFEGVQPADVEGKSCYDVYPAEQAEAFYQDDLSVINSNRPKLGIVEQHTSVGTGKLMWVETGKVPVYNEHGDTTGVLAFAVDITARRETEETLARERNLLRTLIDALPDQVFVKDMQGRLILYNQADARAMGLASTDEALGKTVYDFYPRELADGYHADDMAVIESERPLIDREERGLTEDGQDRWILTTKVPLKDQAGRHLGLVGIARDITQRKQIESTLQESEERFRRFSEATAEGLTFHDRGLILDANPAIVALFGFTTADELIGRNLLEFVVPASRPLVLQKMQLDDVHPYEVLCIRKDGSTFPAETSTRVYRYGERPIRATAVRDITERKRAEAALRENESRLRAIYESSNDAIMLLNAQGFFDCNSYTLELFGIESKEEFIRLHPSDLSPANQPDGQASTTLSQQHIQTAYQQGSNRFEWIHRRVTGEDFPAEVLLSAFEYGGEQVLQATVRDITERKRLEQRVRDSLELREHQVQVSTEVAQHVAAAPELEELFHRVVTLVKERFNYYHAQLFRYVPADDAVELITGYGEIGQKMLAAGHKLAMGRGVVGTAAATGRSILAADVARDRDWRPNPNLPDTKGELAVPIKLGGGDAEAQSHALKHFVDSSFDGIAVSAIDPVATARITYDYLQQGKPVVTLTTDLGPDNQTTLISAVEHELGCLLGVQAGTWAKQHLPDSQPVKVGLLTYRALPNVVQREHGIIDGMQSVIGERLIIVASESALEPKEAAYLAEGWLRAYPDLNMIVAYNDATGLGAYQAAQNAGWHDPDKFFIGGIDAVPEALAAIQQGGIYQATVNQPPEVKGILAVRALVAAIMGLPVKPNYTLYCAPVNRSNAAEFSGPSRAAAVLANQDIIPAEAFSGLDVSGLRLGLSVLTLANPFFAALAKSAQEEAQRLGVQLLVNDPSQVLGVLDVQSDQANALTDDDRLLLEGLCGQLASAMESTRLLETVQQSERLMRTVINATSDWIFIKDQEHRYRLVNQGYADSLHIPIEEFIGKNDLELGFPEELVKGDPDKGIAGFWADDRAVMDSGQTKIIPNDIVMIDGALRTYNTIKTPVRDSTGRVWGVLAFGRDVTERERLMDEQHKRTRQLQTAADVSRAASAFLDVNQLLPEAAELIRIRFELYYVGIFLLDETEHWAVLRAGTGEAGQQMLADGHKLKIGGNSMISQCVETRQARIALDVGEEAMRFDNPWLPATRSEMALPLISRGRTIGAVTIQSAQAAAFSRDDITVLQSMADQISNAVENARLYAQAQTALQEVDAINRRLTGEAWDTYLHQRSDQAVLWAADDELAAPETLTQLDDRLAAGEITIDPDTDNETEATVTAPILLRGQLIGALRMRTPLNTWDKDTTTVLNDIAGHIAQAVENARLIEQTQRTASRERAINEINARVRQSVDLDAILRTAVNELGQSLKAARVVARVGTTAAQGGPVAGGRGETND